MRPGEGVLAGTLRKCRGAFAAAAAFSLMINILMLAAPLYMLQVYDRVLTSRNHDTLIMLTLVAGGAFLTLAALEVVRNVIVVRVGAWIEETLGGTVLAAGIRQGLGRGSVKTVQGLRDLGTLQNFLSGAQIFPIMDAPWTPIFLAVIFVLHPELGWLATGGAIVLLAFAIANELVTRRAFEASGRANIDATAKAEAAVRNADAVHAMGMLPGILARWREASRTVVGLQSKANQRAGLVRAVVRFVRLFLQVAILGYGAWLVLRLELTPGSMIAGSILLARALAPVDQAIASWRAAILARNAYRRLQQTLAGAADDTAATPLPRPSGLVEFENVSFLPQGHEHPIIKKVSFRLEPGSGLGIVGPTASGKSTLVRLLVGSHVANVGHVRLDGMDVAHWDASDRGRHVGYLPQDVELFDASVRDNIARMGDAHPDDVVGAAHLANAHDMIMRLPQGYDTMVGEGGAILSGGQRQRVALARAVFGDPALVVLDEPGASLDQEGESALLWTLLALREQGKTLVVVAHRPSLMRAVDNILVLRDGAVKMFDHRDNVLAAISQQAAQARGGEYETG